MTKAYSNRALPAGTVLREWCLEDVLGVGGFGIVYRARGIYFDELVAIKEYFPGSTSERDEEDTVVPIDSDAEEVHALGLKKFVEEAKLLWNLSTPSRHPNIVNVRSLFEIHGTAYMVMDFEDGVSLSKLLKQKTRFNERSLLNIVRPIAEGLDRAHRVGVLHRDIKPPNILINPDGRPVLIDFGSARFEAAEATSTKVTFHTPPYAAIEQYVKTYPQGPWTDVYALGVVLYECVTGEKPPEVLERLHGSQGEALADTHWPGFSPRFLAAVDAAMTIRPNERPQSIADWLALFEDAEQPRQAALLDAEDSDATRFGSFDQDREEITPVAPPVPIGELAERIQTRVPSDPGEAEFKRAGEESQASGRVRPLAPIDQAAIARAEEKLRDSPPPQSSGPRDPDIHAQPAEANASGRGSGATVAPAVQPRPTQSPPGSAASSGRRRPVLIGGAAAAVVVAGLIGWTVLRQPGAPSGPSAPVLTTASVDPALVRPIPETTTPEVPAAAAAPVADSAAPIQPAAQPISAPKQAAAPPVEHKKVVKPAIAAATAAQASPAEPPAQSSGDGVGSKIAQIAGIVDDGRGMASQVIRMGRDRSGRNGSDQQRKNYQQRQANAQLAAGYDRYLATLKDSARGLDSDRMADRMIAQAKQTRAYLSFLVKQSTGAQ